MKNKLHRKFLVTLITFGILCFFLTTIFGSFLIEKYLEHSMSRSLYQEANNIATYDVVKSSLSSSNSEDLSQIFDAMSTFQSSDFWIINNQNKIVVDTEGKSLKQDVIENFKPSDWIGNYYQIGNFYGHFSEPRLSVIAPITEDMNTKGYVAIHYRMQSLYQQRGKLLLIMQHIIMFFYCIFFVIILLINRWTSVPLNHILKGAGEYAEGNLSYKIPITSEDEFGYLAHTLNYMAEKTNQNSEYQRNFISNVSHDFRSPLTSIKGYVVAILDGTIPVEMQDKYLKIILHETERLEKLTRSLLTLNDLDVKKRMMHITSFDINELIKTAAATFEGTCTKRKIHLELILSGHTLHVKADMDQIQQVLYNLLDNAIKFSPDYSSIILETTERNDIVFVSVRDHGSGIPKESLPKIWERFYKTDASRGKDRKGTGLGLAIVKEIIKAHDQHINVVSTEGVGTEFIFTLEKS